MNNTNISKKKHRTFDMILNLFFIVMCACFVIPLLLVVSASLTSESWLTAGKGFSLIPKEFDHAGLSVGVSQRSAHGAGVHRDLRPGRDRNAAGLRGCRNGGVSAFQKQLPVPQAGYDHYFLHHAVFGGHDPQLYRVRQVLRYQQQLLGIYLPGIAGGAWNTMVFRTFFKGLPESLFESAHLDGAKELTIFFKIVVPFVNAGVRVTRIHDAGRQVE